MRALDLQLLTMRFEELLRGAGVAPRRTKGDKVLPPEKRGERLAEPTAFLLAIRPR